MSIWKPTDITQTPHIQLAQWAIYEVSGASPEPSRHFVGYNLTEREGRVSSAIVEFDRKNLTGKTVSGRIYSLVGEAGSNSDARYVWARWKQMYGITDERLLTEEDL
jgi:hypothetical protein